MPTVSLKSTDGSVKRFPLQGDRLTIGRSRESHVFLPDQWLSRHHAEIRQHSDGFYLVDLGSKNGTMLNGFRVHEPQLLRDGDTISLSEHVLTFANDETVEEVDDSQSPGTKVFSARELSGVDTKPTVDPGEMVRQGRLLNILSQAVSALLDHRPLPELFELILNLLFQAVPAERAAVLLLEGSPPQPVVKASRSRSGPPLTKVSRSIAQRVLADRVSLLLPNLLEDAAFKSQDSILSTGIRSALCAPLWFTPSGAKSDEVIGLVYLDSIKGSHSFTEDDVRILTPLAHVAAAKIENVRLLEQSIEMRKLEQDMRMAADIQKGLLPSRAPTVPGYDMVGSNRPCRTVGGDYYDFDVHNGELLLALGDVSGKGTSAALLMSVLRSAVRTHWGEGTPVEACTRTNQVVCRNVPENKFVTFFLGRIQPETGVLRYVNAGHNPPLLVHSDGQVETLTEGGMVLGMFDWAPYKEGSVPIREGDVLLIYSDGITETFSATHEEFGEKGVIDLLQKCRDCGAEQIQSALLQELDRFGGAAGCTDDRTLIVVKRVGNA